MAGSFYLHNLSFKATVSASAAIASSTNTAATIRVTATGSIPSGYNVTSTGIVANITINGQSSGHLTIFGNGTSYAGSQGAKSVTYDVTVDKGTSAKSISWSVEFRNAVDGTVITSTANNGVKHTENGTVSVPAKPSYTIAYNANGGSGAPGSQTKWYGVTLTLSSSVPTRTGYTFQGWALSKAEADAGTWYYQPGGTCGKNENLTLYAVWKANTYTVSYNANGGSGAPGNQTKTHDISLTLSSTVPTRTNYTFKGWGTSASATTASYQPGGSYTANNNITLYAIWELNYIKPRITNLSVDRWTSDSGGVLSESGTYARIKFNWACDRTVSSITVSWTSATGGSGSDTVSATGTSGTVDEFIGSGGFSEESTYTIDVKVTDTVDSFTKTTILNGIVLAIDVHKGADGVAFGKPAELSGVADFGFNARFIKNVYGNAVGLSELPQIPANASLNSYMNTGCYAISSNAVAATVSNLPPSAAGAAGRLFVADAIGAGNNDGYVYRRQVYIPYRVGYGFSVRDLTGDSNGAWTYGDWYTYMPTKA